MSACLDPEKREIRLLQVKKRANAGQGSLLTRTITTSLLDPEHQPYICLSYVWFDPTPVYNPELVPDYKLEDTDSPIAKLQPNALAALLQLAEEDSILTIWIDACCVNQDDRDERSSQVAMMNLIYQNAEEVIAWLGPDTETGLGFQVIDNLAAFAQDYFEERWFQWCYRSSVPAEERRADQYHEDDNGEKIPAWDKVLEAAQDRLPEWFEPDDENGRPAEKIFPFILTGLSTFWTRAWIFQELAFARKARIQYGSVSTTLANFLVAIKTWHGLSAAAEYATIFGAGSGQSQWNPGEFADNEFNRPMTNKLPMRNMLISIVAIREGDAPAVSTQTLPLRLLVLFSEFNATDARDKVFALWGFVDETGPNAWLLRPDYTLSIEQVFARAARYMIVTHRQLTMLTTHSHGKAAYQMFVRTTFGKSRANTELLDLPSWVPDWREALMNSTLQQSHSWMHDHHWGRQPVFSDEEFERLVQFSEDGRTLKTKGMRVGEISDVFGGQMFPYPVEIDDDDEREVVPFHSRFANFVKLTAHGKEVLSQYLRFVFRSSEGSTNALLDYDVDLRTPIQVMKFLDDDKILVTEEVTFGSRIIKFLVRLIGENDLLGLRASGMPIEEKLAREGKVVEEVFEEFLASNAHGGVALSTWWPTFISAFDDFDTWPPAMQEDMKATACGVGLSEKDRQASMEEVQAWIGTKTFNFFVIHGLGLGVCPNCVKPEVGDVVWRFAASDGPVVLRPVGQGCEIYRVVGECWVADKEVRGMDGEEWTSKMNDLRWAEIV